MKTIDLFENYVLDYRNKDRDRILSNYSAEEAYQTALIWFDDGKIKYEPIQAIEKVIAPDPIYAYNFARYIIKGPFPEGEKAIATNAETAAGYAEEVLKGPFPDGEITIATNTESSYNYAIGVLQGRFELGEPAIFQSLWFTYCYIEDLAYSDNYDNSLTKIQLSNDKAFKLLTDESRIIDMPKSGYDKVVKLIYPTSSLLVNKWIRYGDRRRRLLSQ